MPTAAAASSDRAQQHKMAYVRRQRCGEVGHRDSRTPSVRPAKPLRHNWQRCGVGPIG